MKNTQQILMVFVGIFSILIAEVVLAGVYVFLIKTNSITVSDQKIFNAVRLKKVTIKDASGAYILLQATNQGYPGQTIGRTINLLPGTYTDIEVPFLPNDATSTYAGKTVTIESGSQISVTLRRMNELCFTRGNDPTLRDLFGKPVIKMFTAL
ncbi:hypothetical protein HY947_04690 [Candidatus Gottesmanbacteria bacterium]|nr:hypothetical protein [Candidatus Gottesmanbacteria bacterium]